MTYEVHLKHANLLWRLKRNPYVNTRYFKHYNRQFNRAKLFFQ